MRHSQLFSHLQNHVYLQPKDLNTIAPILEPLLARAKNQAAQNA